MGNASAYGPFPITEEQRIDHAVASGYQSVQAEHITDGDLCGTCHNLYTPFLNSTGEIAGEFPEQTIHLEWENSAFGGGSCANCHMPKSMMC